MHTEDKKGSSKPFHIYETVVIASAIIAGVVLTILAEMDNIKPIFSSLFTNFGTSLLATAFISLILELVWSNQRTQAEKDELQPIYEKLKDVPDKLGKLEGRLEAFKQLGFNNCYASRNDALKTFLSYAQSILKDDDQSLDPSSERSFDNTINIVSSSARGLVGYIDREPSKLQKDWRNIITTHPRSFRILLTHPAFAHLRQPAEERASGDIELEILKTAIYLHCVAGMKANELRLYRGSPTVFAIQVGDHILLNPYPYGTMAMDTLCLEFERGQEGSYISKFTHMHFNHTWAFIDQPSKTVDNKSLVAGIDSFDDILDAFSECTFLSNPRRLRLTRSQVEELDRFICKRIRPESKDSLPESPAPFKEFMDRSGLACSDQEETNARVGNEGEARKQ